MNILTNNIVFDALNHTYSHAETGVVPSVTTILRPSNNSNNINTYAMQSGNFVHQALEICIQSKDDKKLSEFLALSTKAEQHKINQIIETLNVLALTPTHAELAFILNNEKLSYAGTVDLVCEDSIVDYKTGKLYPYHYTQISAYAKALGKEKAFIIYFDNKKVNYITLNQKRIEQEYKYFHSLLKNYLGITLDQDTDLLETLRTFDGIEQLIKQGRL